MPAQRVLIVEDELILAMMLEETLAGEGYTVIGPIGRLAGAIALARSAEIDAAVLDVNLYGEAIYPVAEVLMERGVPFAFLTGYGSESIPARYRHGIVVTKPFRTEVLLEALRELVGPGSDNMVVRM